MATAIYANGKVEVNGTIVDIPQCYMPAYATYSPPFYCNNSSGGLNFVDHNFIELNPSPVTVSGYGSPLWCTYNGVVQSPWDAIYQQQDGLDHEVLRFSNGKYVTAKRQSNYGLGRLDLGFYNSDGTQIGYANWYAFSSDVLYSGFTVLENSNGDILFERFSIVPYEGKYFWGLCEPLDGVYGTLSMVTEIDPGYIWEAWDQISGTDGEYKYTVNLTKEKESVLTNLSTGKISTSADFDRISSQSSIWAKLQNMPIGQETPIAYSGRGRLTLTLSTTGVYPGNYNCIYKFYNPDGTTPFFTQERIIIYSGTNPHSNIYLSFAYDNEHQAAVFLPVEYEAEGIGQGYGWGGVSPTTDEMLYLWLWLQLSGAGEDDRPYNTGSTDDGGDPAGPQPGDHMGQASVPTLSGMSTKLFSVYCPTEEQLADIADYLWDNNVITNIRKYFSNFADNIISLYVLPYSAANLPTKNFKVGNMESEDITGVKYLNVRFVSLDMGTAVIKNEYDSYLDYSPYTKIECFLPGIGTVALDADDIMSPTDPDTGTLKTKDEIPISLKYTLDLMTGIIVAFIFIDGEQRYQFSGKLGYEIPLTGQTYANMVRGFIQAAAGLVGTVATGGLSAPIQAASVSAAVSGTVNAMKPEIHRSGNLTGDASMLGEKTPYLIYHKPNKPLLENQQIFTGFPSYKSGKLSEFEGLTSVIDAHVEGISCTEAERAEILQLLKSGVII